VLDSRGEPPDGLFGIDGEDYKLTLKDSSGTTVWTVDDVRMPVALPYLQTSEESSASVTPTDVSYPPGHILRYGANTTPGTTDMATALLNATKALSSGGTVYIPAGTYAIGSNIAIANSGLKFQGDGAKSIVRASATGYNLFTATAKSDLTFEDIKFEGAETTAQASSCIQLLASSDRAIVKDCIFSGPDATTGFNVGIIATTCDNVQVSGCLFNTLVGTTSGNGYGIQLNTDCLYGRITDNTFDMAISGSDSGRHAVYLSAGTSYTTVRGNKIDDCLDEAISVFSTTEAGNNFQVGLVITENIIKSCGNKGIGLTGQVRGAVVSNNQIIDNDSDTKAAIEVEGNATNTPTHNIITSNYMETIDNIGVKILGGDDNLIANNIVKGFSLGTADTYAAIHLTENASTGGDRNIVLGNSIIQETTQARAGIQTDVNVLGTIIRGNTVTGSYLIDDIEDDSINSIVSDNSASVLNNAVTGTVTIPSTGITKMDITSAVTATLGSGVNIGDVKVVVVSAGATSSTLSVTNHETTDPEVITFTAVDDTAVLMWTGTEWMTIELSGASV
jgi:hypothetical protein